MSKIENIKEEKGIIGWIEYRLPIFAYINDFVGANYKTPKNLNFLWNFGFLAGFSLVIQMLTGIFLAMHYDPNALHAFQSVDHIDRDVNYGWLIRYCHQVGASMFFLAVYTHIFRGLYYGSYKKPRELLWIIGVIIFFAMMATAFVGYVLPWGQMSFWGATVITNLFSAIPFIGEGIVHWIWGGFAVNNATLNRFFALHYLLPFIILALVFVHLMALHRFGSNNPTGIDVKTDKDTVGFHPYYTAKDFITIILYLIIFFAFVFFAPDYLGHSDNFIPADPMITPQHIVPEWYFLPFYAILRAIPNKLIGVAIFFSSVMILFAVPWLDRHKIRSGNYRPIFKWCYLIFVFNFIFLIWLGAQEAIEPYISLSRVATIYYFSYFLGILPLLSLFEKNSELPASLSEAVPHMK